MDRLEQETLDNTQAESDTKNESDTQTESDMDEYYYDDYGGDFSLNQKSKMGGGAGKKRQNKKDKSKGAGDTIYNSKHIRVSETKKENGKRKDFGKNNRKTK